MSDKLSNYTYVCLTNGFYFFGEEVPAPEGFIRLVNASMFGGFSGNKGFPGVVRQDPDAEVTLDRFEPTEKLDAPMSAVVFIVKANKNPYEWKNAKLR